MTDLPILEDTRYRNVVSCDPGEEVTCQGLEKPEAFGNVPLLSAWMSDFAGSPHGWYYPDSSTPDAPQEPGGGGNGAGHLAACGP